MRSDGTACVMHVKPIPRPLSFYKVGQAFEIVEFIAPGEGGEAPMPVIPMNKRSRQTNEDGP